MANLGAINNPYGGSLTDSPGAGQPSPAEMAAYIRSIGGNTNEATMLTGAAASESGLNPTQTHDGGIGYGMFGHNGTRLLAMKQYASQTGQPLSDWRTQAQYGLQELRSRPEGKAVANATTPEQLALAQMYYERPQGFTPDNPEQGHNYTGRLNTIKSFTALDPNATGSFAPSANPQVTPASVAAATSDTAALPAGKAPAVTPGMGAPNANAFAQVGNPQLNAALAKILAQSQQPGGAPAPQTLVGQIVSPITAPIKQAIGGDLGGLKNLLSGAMGSDGSGGTAADVAQDARQDAPDYAPQPQQPLTPDAAPVASASPTFTQPGVLDSLAGLFGGSAGA